MCIERVEGEVRRKGAGVFLRSYSVSTASYSITPALTSCMQPTKKANACGQLQQMQCRTVTKNVKRNIICRYCSSSLSWRFSTAHVRGQNAAAIGVLLFAAGAGDEGQPQHCSAIINKTLYSKIQQHKQQFTYYQIQTSSIRNDDDSSSSSSSSSSSN